MDIKTTLKASVAAAALVAVSAPVVSSSAQAGLANGNDNGVVISGNVTRSLMYVDNGIASEWTHVDGGNDTNSRLRIIVSGQLTESVAVGGIWEANLPASNAQGSQVTNAVGGVGRATDAGDSGSFGFRKADVSFTHATAGKLSIGQNSTASDNKPSLDSTGNNNAGMTYGGGTQIFDKTAAADAGKAGSAFSSYFGGRKDRVRYDTPNIAGFKASAAIASDDFVDVGLTYGATYGDIQIAAAGQWASSSTDTETWGVGLAVKHSSGISAGAHYGTEDTDAAFDGSSWGVEVGYTTSAMSNLGATSFNVVYTVSNDTTVNNDEAKLWGFHAKQSLPAGVAVFAAYETSEFDDNSAATNLQDIDVALIGTQISF